MWFIHCPHVEPGSRTCLHHFQPSHSMSLTDFIISVSFFIICSLALIPSCSSLSCFFFSQLSLLSLSLSLSFSLSHCCCELPFPCTPGVVIPKSKRELLKKHLWLPPSLWLCSSPIFTTGPFEVMNEKWQYSSSDLRNRLVRAIHWQLETSQVLNASAGLHSVFLLLISVIKSLNQAYVKALKKE